MQVGEVKPIVVLPNRLPTPPGAVTFTHAISVLLIATSPSGVRKTFSMTPADDGLSATYITQVSDFDEAGVWEVQLVADFGSVGHPAPLISRIDEIVVGDDL
jgi:hypothetical protein